MLFDRGCYTHMSSILLGDTMVPNKEQDYLLLLGYSILYKEYNLTRCNHQKKATHMSHSLNSIYRGHYIGEYYGVTKGDTTNLDYSSYSIM